MRSYVDRAVDDGWSRVDALRHVVRRQNLGAWTQCQDSSGRRSDDMAWIFKASIDTVLNRESERD